LQRLYLLRAVLVIEKRLIASGASSKSSRLIHGGLRYLEHLEFSLVKEALIDQKYLLEKYPELVQLHPFYLPIYKNSKRLTWMISLALFIYSFFSKHGQKTQKINKKIFLKKFPLIKEDNLKTVFMYFDGKTDDTALTQKVALEAKNHGVNILENTSINKINIMEKIIKLDTSEGIFKTNTLINATGAWIDEINKKFNLPSSYTIEKLSGIHLIINKVLVAEPLILETSTKRIFFIIPESKTTIIGTTERSEKNNVDDIKVNNADVKYLLNESNIYMKTKLTRKDILEVYIGTRAIIKSKNNPTKMSREYKLDLHHIGENKILNIYGGKLTSFPSLAKKVARILM